MNMIYGLDSEDERVWNLRDAFTQPMCVIALSPTGLVA